MNIVLIGAGNLATNLGKTLHNNGQCIKQVYSRTPESAKSLADRLGAAYTTSLETIEPTADLYIVSLKDAAFVELLPSITVGKSNALWVHTAGSIPMSIWEGYVVRYGVFYPMQTFSKQREVCFREIPFFVEANNASDLELLKSLASSVSEKVYEASSEQRKYLHLSAVFANNFTNHMYALTAKLLNKYHLPFEVMLPLIDETARKVHDLSPIEAQTGPAVRYDENVIKKQLEMLIDEPQMQELYEKISKNIHQMKK
ncbi:MAG: DUF2520 domain-containing protein [Bacteroides sp.]